MGTRKANTKEKYDPAIDNASPSVSAMSTTIYIGKCERCDVSIIVQDEKQTYLGKRRNEHRHATEEEARHNQAVVRFDSMNKSCVVDR